MIIKTGQLYYRAYTKQYLKVGEDVNNADEKERKYYEIFDEHEFDQCASRMPCAKRRNNKALVKDIIDYLAANNFKLVTHKEKREEYSVSSGLFDIDDL